MSSGFILSRLLAAHQPNLPSTSRFVNLARQSAKFSHQKHDTLASRTFLFSSNSFRQKSWTFWRGFRSKRTQNQPQSEPIRKGSPELYGEVLKSVVVEERTLKDLVKPALFTVGFCGACLVSSVIWQEERRAKTQKRLKEFFQRQGLGWGWGRDSHGYKHEVPKRGEIRESLNAYAAQVREQWEALSPGQQTIFALVGANALVYLAWKLPQLRPLMDRFFISSIHLKHNCQSMLWSTFSHKVFLHGAINMYVLNSFGPMLIDTKLGIEQFLGLYLAAGVVSSMAGCTYKLLTSVRAFSVGASGAILGILGYTLCVYPDIQLSIIFLPMFTFSARTALVGILCFDTAGLILGFKLFDHAAHLGGTLFGVLYALYGEKFVDGVRPSILRWWKSIRERKPSDSF